MVTEARLSKSDDIAYRQRRYLIMMAIRAVCFIVAVIMFVNHAGWLTAFPAVGAIIIPYFAVVFANGGREPSGRERFRPYEPNLPQQYQPPAGTSEPHGGSNGRQPGSAEPGGTDIPGSAGAPPRSG